MSPNFLSFKSCSVPFLYFLGASGGSNPKVIQLEQHSEIELKKFRHACVRAQSVPKLAYDGTLPVLISYRCPIVPKLWHLCLLKYQRVPVPVPYKISAGT